MTNRSKISLYLKVLATTSLVALCVPAFANPEGGTFIGGSGTITTSGNTTDIKTSTYNAAAQFTSFNTNPNEVVNIEQLSNGSTFLAMVKGTDPSFFFGQLNANGNVVLSNPNGVLFGKTAHVDVNSLVATTAIPSNIDQFINHGTLELNHAGSPNGFVVNNGLITAGDAGLVGLVAPHVENNGVILARLGRVHLASGDTATVDFFGDGLIEIAVSDDVTSQTIINTGIIHAQGGTIALTAAASKKMVDSLIVVSGELRAPSFEEKNGKIIIHAEGSNKTEKQGMSTLLLDGIVDVSGNEIGQSGGQVRILGDQVALLKGAIVDASGDVGGGDVKIGGDYLGMGETPTARTVYVDTETFIFNDAHTAGDGGRVIVWSDDITQFHGNIFARGGINGGNGGFVETSGKENLRADGFVDLSARYHTGHKGTYLLDPADITIYGHFNPQNIAGNVLHLDASDPTTIIDSAGKAANDVDFNGTVATWLDQSSHNNNVSNADLNNQPNYVQDGKNSQGIVAFDKTDVLFAQNDDVLSLDFSDNAFSYFGVVSPEITTQARTLFSKANSYVGAIRSSLFQAKVETQDSGFWNWGGATEVAAQWHQLGFQHANTVWNFFQNGSLAESITPANNEIGAIQSSDGEFAIGGSVDGDFSRDFFAGEMAEILMYDRVLDQSSKNLLDQYQSAKWDIDLSPSGAGIDEVSRATASDGYGEFTTRYLERLSETADIHLQASNSITLDLKGDTLALAQDKSISLTTDAGDIRSISGGSLKADRSMDGGNVTVIAGGTGNIDFGDLTIDAQNGGVVRYVVEDGDLIRHQNYIEPVMDLPETVVARTPLVETLNFKAPSDPQSLSGLDGLVSFDSGSQVSFVSQEEDVE